MKISISVLILLFSFSFYFSSAQEITEIQSFVYDSETRDTVIDFPTVSNNNFEKIWMVYSMRCKDGLVSDGADRNRGCGEWDYSCNTYIHDSTRVDSSKAVHPDFLISNFSGTVFNYTTQPTYTYYEYNHKDVVYNATNSETIGTLGTGSTSIDLPFGNNNNEVKAQFIYNSTDLFNAGLTAGEITGLQLDLDAQSEGYRNFRIKMKNTGLATLSPSNVQTDGFTQVYFNNTDFGVAGTQSFNFYEPFVWDGSNVIVEFSYSKEESIQATVKGDEVGENIGLISSYNDYSIEFGGAENVEINEPLNEISKEITLSFWNYGGDNLPVNTSIVEGKDNSNRRQVNVHMPWSNGRVYWDCGNDGGGYDRIDKAANDLDYKNKWNHWAFTKNTTTGSMKIYLNGSLWHSDTGKTREIDIQSLIIGSSVNATNNYYGKVDEFRIWDKELSQTTILDWMFKSVDNSHPDYNSLVSYYTFNEGQSDILKDSSPNNHDGAINGGALYRVLNSSSIYKEFESTNKRPKTSFVQGDYNQTINDLVFRDSLINPANRIEEFTVVGTDLVSVAVGFVYASGNMFVYDESGSVVSTVNVPSENSITIGELDYYRKSPGKYEIVSFVTPYGIFLDLGWEGKAWYFDVTDFGPILNGKKRITMERGGQWQEDIDIKFLFVEGTPSRDVIDIQQVWPATAEGYTRITSDEKFEPRDFPVRSDASMFKLTAAITGHGQEGEFIPRDHYLNVNGGAREIQWQVWKECGENPVHPQGGTWVYDRAGWCPGMATDVLELDITDEVTPGQISELDYGLVAGASGDSRYIVNVQMVSYGDPNFTIDAGILDIKNPSKKIAYGKYNPLCTNPVITIVNNGLAPLSSLDITYGVEDGEESVFTWTGNLDFLETADVELPNMPLTNMIKASTFYAAVSSPNGATDEYANNNEMSSPFDIVNFHNNDVILTLRTNNAYWETRYTLTDSEGNIVHERGDGLSASTLYVDTLENLNGCYKLHITDSGSDGISWWANNDGNGYIQVRGVGESAVTLEPDFGALLVYEFIAGDGVTDVETVENNKFINVFPNPSSDIFNVELDGFSGDLQISLTNHLGQTIYTGKINNPGGGFNSTQLDLSNELDGIYYLNIVDGDQTLVRKLVKN
jgi:hypothetical protein